MMDISEDTHVDKSDAWDIVSRKNAEIARLTAALSTARNDALQEAADVCRKEANEVKGEGLPLVAMGANFCRESIAALITRTAMGGE